MPAASSSAGAAADDLLAPTLLEKCVAALDSDPGAVMAWPQTRIIDEDSKPIRDNTFVLPTDSANPARRFGALINVKHKKHGAFEIFSLIRLQALCSFPRKGSYARADSVVLARLSLFGRFHLVREYLFLNRDHRGRSVRSLPDTAQPRAQPPVANTSAWVRFLPPNGGTPPKKEKLFSPSGGC